MKVEPVGTEVPGGAPLFAPDADVLELDETPDVPLQEDAGTDTRPAHGQALRVPIGWGRIPVLEPGPNLAGDLHLLSRQGGGNEDGECPEDPEPNAP